MSDVDDDKWKNKTEETGTVKFISPQGYGFVVRSGNKRDAFFHVQRLPEHVRGSIKAGDRVRMVVGEGPKGPTALTVSKVEN